MIGFTGRTDQDGKQQFEWNILGYEMQHARHSFIGLSLNTENSVSNVADTRLWQYRLWSFQAGAPRGVQN